MKRKIIKRALIVIGIIAAAFVAFVGFFAVKGAIMWHNAKSKYPIEVIIPQIQSESGFVRCDELPEFYINAVISVEDRQFFKHNGISVRSITRAVLHDVWTLSLEQGGSTITQQLAKNLWFSQEKTFERKFAEVYAAFELENALSKNEIFELYVNTSFFGNDCYGVAQAADGYFGKPPAELTDYECAMLAGLPNAPSALAASPEAAKKRLALVLNCMRANGVITEEKAQEVLTSGG